MNVVEHVGRLFDVQYLVATAAVVLLGLWVRAIWAHRPLVIKTPAGWRPARSDRYTHRHRRTRRQPRYTRQS